MDAVQSVHVILRVLQTAKSYTRHRCELDILLAEVGWTTLSGLGQHQRSVGDFDQGGLDACLHRSFSPPAICDSASCVRTMQSTSRRRSTSSQRSSRPLGRSATSIPIRKQSFCAQMNGLLSPRLHSGNFNGNSAIGRIAGNSNCVPIELVRIAVGCDHF